ncbi:MAG: CHAP domain-containing protein [Chitinispirillaceae bacterium]|nr:CHAP domain-containing protein [Chitinispirillaceae bacterium]
MAGYCRTVIVILYSVIYFRAVAENICDEVPPDERYVDGIPAYEQCSASDGSVYSNNGVDTRSTREDGWKRTQWGGGYQCTEYACRYLQFVWGVESVPNGNAGSWCDARIPEGLVKTDVPVHGDVIVFAPGVCGASAETGHVAVVDIVKDSTLTIVEQNRAGRRRCKLSCASCFLHAKANNGIVATAGNLQHRRRRVSRIQVLRVNSGVSVLLPDKTDLDLRIQLYTLHGRLVADLCGHATDGTVRLTPDAAVPRTGVMVLRTEKRILYRGLFTFL